MDQPRQSTRAEWRIEREQIFIEWRKDIRRNDDLIFRVNVELSKLPTAQRDELFRAIILGGNAEFRTNPDQSMLLPSEESPR